MFGDESADPLRRETPQEPPLLLTTGACERSDRLATEYTSNHDLQRDSELRQMGLNLSTLRTRLQLVNWPKNTKANELCDLTKSRGLFLLHISYTWSVNRTNGSISQTLRPQPFFTPMGEGASDAKSHVSKLAMGSG